MHRLAWRCLKLTIASSCAVRLSTLSAHGAPLFRRPTIAPVFIPRRCYASTEQPNEPESSGKETPVPEKVKEDQDNSTSPFYFEAGYALFAKRASRPFPPPFISMPSSSFSDPLSTHNRAKDKSQPEFEGEMIRGVTNGDDAVLVSPRLIAANDGVGQWAQKERGHAALWSRLIIHFWALEAERDSFGEDSGPDPKAYLQRAFETTKQVTTEPNEWYGTTTVSGALISSKSADGDGSDPKPVLHVTQLGDSTILVIRPRDNEYIFKTEEQWHWFDCPRQLGTNSPDTPDGNAILDKIDVEENDVVLAMSDGVVDNLWVHEIVENVVESVKKQESKLGGGASSEDYKEGMKFVAEQLCQAAKVIAQDPYAESPFMERAIDEGLPAAGGKLDDISVVAALVVRRHTHPEHNPNSPEPPLSRRE